MLAPTKVMCIWCHRMHAEAATRVCKDLPVTRHSMTWDFDPSMPVSSHVCFASPVCSGIILARVYAAMIAFSTILVIRPQPMEPGLATGRQCKRSSDIAQAVVESHTQRVHDWHIMAGCKGAEHILQEILFIQSLDSACLVRHLCIQMCVHGWLPPHITQWLNRLSTMQKLST